MSKQALSRLLKEISPIEASRTYKKGDNTPYQKSIAGSSSPYRKQVLDKNSQIFSLGTVAEIAKQLELEILEGQPSLIQDGTLTPADFKSAAEKLNETFRAGNANRTAEDTFVYNTYDPLQKKLAVANKAAFAIIEAKIKAAGKTIGNRVSSRGKVQPNIDINLTSPDHTRESAIIRISEVFSRGLSDPLGVVRKLGQYGGLTEKSETAFLEQHVDIRSYYINDQTKAFDITVGAKVKLRSKKDNEAAGRGITKAMSEEIYEAAKKAVANVNWADQDGSDSYAKFVLKSLNNAAVKAGATGKIERIDKSKNFVKQETLTRIPVYKRKTNKTGVKKTAPKAQPSYISMQSIVNYINARLTPALEKNMTGNGTLRNRTGRFASSAKIVGAIPTAQGGISLAYKYQRSPYDVFDKTLGKSPWKSPGRDPSTLIQRTVREIAQELAIGRFYMRRV